MTVRPHPSSAETARSRCLHSISKEGESALGRMFMSVYKPRFRLVLSHVLNFFLTRHWTLSSWHYKVCLPTTTFPRGIHEISIIMLTQDNMPNRQQCFSYLTECPYLLVSSHSVDDLATLRDLWNVSGHILQEVCHLGGSFHENVSGGQMPSSKCFFSG